MSKEDVARQVGEAAKEAQKKRKNAGRPGSARRRKKSFFPFKADETGIFRRVPREDGDGADWVRFGSEMRVLARTRNHDGEEHGLWVEVVDCDGVAHRWAMPASMLAGSGESIRAELLSLGYQPDLTAGRKWRDWLFEYFLTAEPETRVRCVSGVGWHGASFVFPDTTYSAGEDSEAVILQAGARLEHAYHVEGSLGDWRTHVARPALGNSRLVLAISTAFASPLLSLTEEDGGGFHFRGGSSVGKSTSLHVAASVWGGGGTQGYVRAWRATDNALEALAAMHNGPVLLLDELSQIEPKAAGQAAYMLSNGRGKARAGKEGQARRGHEWRLLFLSTGEIALADKIREGGGQIAAGMEVRVIDVRADAGAGRGLFEEIGDAPDSATFAQNLKAAAGRYYGTPARAFLEYLVSDLAEVREQIKALRREFCRAALPDEADGQVWRVADRFALVAAAGDLASTLGITGWPEGAAREAALRCFADWLNERGGAGSGELFDAKGRLREAIETYGQARFQKWHYNSDRAVISPRWGFVRSQDQDGNPVEPHEWFFTSSALAETLRGLDFKAVRDALLAEGIIVPQGAGRTPNKVFHVPNAGAKVRLFQINYAKLNECGAGDG